MKTSRSAIALIALFQAGCSLLARRIPEIEIYEYSDLENHRYRIKFANGKIADTSWVFDSGGKEIEILKWNRPKKNVVSVDTIFSADKNRNLRDTCSAGKGRVCQRSTESILKVVRKGAPKFLSIYNNYLSRTYFSGKVTLIFKINPEGEIKYLYLTGNSTGIKEFALEILQKANTWKFERIDGSSFDVVTVPFTFSP